MNQMAIAPLQPHRSWYKHFWYNERSPLRTLADRVLIFAILALSLLAIGTRAQHHPPSARAMTPDASVGRLPYEHTTIFIPRDHSRPR